MIGGEGVRCICLVGGRVIRGVGVDFWVEDRVGRVKSGQ